MGSDQSTELQEIKKMLHRLTTAMIGDEFNNKEGIVNKVADLEDRVDGLIAKSIKTDLINSALIWTVCAIVPTIIGGIAFLIIKR